mgnify:CR=1 FL=1
MKHLVGKVITKEVSFMGDTVQIRKLSVNEVLTVQKIVQKANKAKGEEAQIMLLQDVIKVAVPEAQELTNEDFKTFPIGELSELTESILSFAGLSGESATGN